MFLIWKLWKWKVHCLPLSAIIHRHRRAMASDVCVLPGREVYRPACIHRQNQNVLSHINFPIYYRFFPPSPSLVCSLFSGYHPTTTTRFQLCKLLAHMFFNLFSYDLEPCMHTQRLKPTYMTMTNCLYTHPKVNLNTSRTGNEQVSETSIVWRPPHIAPCTENK